MIQLTVNNTLQQIDLDPQTPLLWVLRDHLRLTGTKYGCGTGICGVCTVHLNGQPIRSCTTPLERVNQQTITTIEGLNSATGQAVKQAWQQLNVVQCGYCQPGQIMTASALLTQNPNPDEATIDRVMSGNLCRCATYFRIRKAIHQATEILAQTKKVAAS